MKVSQWAEIRRLAEVEGLPQRQIAERLRCCWRTVKKALAMQQPPDETRRPHRGSILDPHKPKIDALITKYPQLSAGARVGRDPQGTGRIHGPSLRGAQLSAADPAGSGTHLSGGVLRSGTGSASGLGQLRVPQNRHDHSPRLGVRGGAVLQPSVLHRILPLRAQGRVLPVPGPGLEILWRYSPSDHLRQPEGRGPERLGETRLLASGLFGAVRPLLSAAHRLRVATQNRKGSWRRKCAT